MVRGDLHAAQAGGIASAEGIVLAAIEPDVPLAISITEEEGELAGTLWVTGGIPILRADGQPWEQRNRVMLCRCGQSANKPLCDGTHRRIAFQEQP